MKKIFKKNQIVIGTLAVMIAVAGYLHFTGEQVTEEEVIAQIPEDVITETGEDVTALLDISEEDLENGELVTIESMDDDGMQFTENYIEEDLTIEEIPGEAVFTSGVSVTSLSSARLAKEQTRAQNRESLMEIINSETADEASIQEATASMIALTDVAERETAAEILLEARGYTETVVSITGDSADVVVGLSELTDSQCAQIIDIVSRKAEIDAANVIITPVTAD